MTNGIGYGKGGARMAVGLVRLDGGKLARVPLRRRIARVGRFRARANPSAAVWDKPRSGNGSPPGTEVRMD